MKYAAVSVFALSLLGESNIATLSFDREGRPTEVSRLIRGAGGAREVVVRDVNGRTVTKEVIEERVVSDAGGLRKTERLVRRANPNGAMALAEKILIEEHKQQDGSVQTTTVVMQAGASGNMAVVERVSAKTEAASAITTTHISIERPDVNNRLAVAETAEQVVRQLGPGAVEETRTVQRRDVAGRPYDSAKLVVRRSESDSGSEENSAAYELSSTGRLDLIRQTVSRVVRTGDGERKEVDIYDTIEPGRVHRADAKPRHLREQQIFETRKTPSGSVQTLSVRQPVAPDADRLGPARKIEEAICTGECDRK